MQGFLKPLEALLDGLHLAADQDLAYAFDLSSSLSLLGGLGHGGMRTGWVVG
jgi:hypothetical protein